MINGKPEQLRLFVCSFFSERNKIGEIQNVEIRLKMFNFAADLYYRYGDRSYITGA
jgi:hypothetical protein